MEDVYSRREPAGWTRRPPRSVGCQEKRRKTHQTARRVGECTLPEEPERIRYTGLNPLPVEVKHASYEHLFQNDTDNTAIERILAERQVDGKTEFQVRWVGFGESHDEWIPEDRFTAGLNSLLLYWQEHNRVVEEKKQMNENKKKANEAVAPATVAPINRDNLTAGDAVAILAPKGTVQPFYLGRVIKSNATKVNVHWYGHNKTVNDTYILQFKAKDGKGVGPAIEGTVWLETVIDTVLSMKGKQKGKIEKVELKRLIALAQQSNA